MSTVSTIRPVFTTINGFFEKTRIMPPSTQNIWGTFPLSSPSTPSLHSDASSNRAPSIFDEASDIDDDATSITSISSDELRVDLAFVDGYDPAEEADDEDYLDIGGPCPCADCGVRTGRIPGPVDTPLPVPEVEQGDARSVMGSSALATDDNDAEDIPPSPSPSIQRQPSLNAIPFPLPDPVSNGSWLYQPWPLPIGAGRPIRSPVQGQKTIISNVTNTVTPATEAPVQGDLGGLLNPSSGLEAFPFLFHFTPPTYPEPTYTFGASALLRSDEDEVVGGRGMRSSNQRWAF